MINSETFQVLESLCLFILIVGNVAIHHFATLADGGGASLWLRVTLIVQSCLLGIRVLFRCFDVYEGRRNVAAHRMITSIICMYSFGIVVWGVCLLFAQELKNHWMIVFFVGQVIMSGVATASCVSRSQVVVDEAPLLSHFA